MRNSHYPQDRGNRQSRNDESDDRFRHQANQQHSRTASSGNYEDREDARFDPSGDHRRTSHEYYGQGSYSRDYGQQGPQRGQRSMQGAYSWGERNDRGGYQDREGEDYRWRGMGSERFQEHEPNWGSEQHSRYGEHRNEHDQGDFGRRESGFGSEYGERDYRSHSGYDQPRDSPGRFTETHGSQQRRGPKGWQRSDERIKDDVSERLYHHRGVDCSDVSVEVSGGKVTLEGTVPERRMKHAIEDMIDQCPGVKDIENRIRVQRNGEGGSSSSMGPSALSASQSTSGYAGAASQSGGATHTSGTSGGGSHTTGKEHQE